MKEQHKRPLGDEKDENVKEINGAGETDTDVDENDEEEEDDDDDDFDEVTVDFEFFDPKDIDFHGLRALLGSYLDDQPCELSDLVNTIISQAWQIPSCATEDALPVVLLGVVCHLMKPWPSWCPQRTVGTVLKTAEDEDPIGVATVLNLKRHSKLEALKQIKEFLMRSTKESAMKSNIEKVRAEIGCRIHFLSILTSSL